MATTLQKGLFGGDPVAMQQAEKQQWAAMYGQAGSPYEKMGLALAQLGGAVLAPANAIDTKAAAVNKALQNAAAQYQQGTAEYYKAIAEDPALSEYSDSKEFATQKYLETKKAETTAYTDSVKAIKDNPELAPTFIDPLKISLLQKATKNGWNEADTPIPQTMDEIKSFAKQYGVDKDPMFRQMVSLQAVADKEAKNEQVKAEKDLLSVDQIKANIRLDNARLGQIGKDDFDKGARWNAENAAARQFLEANKVDLNKPLTGAAKANPAFVEAYQKALRNDWTGSKGITSPSKPSSPSMTPVALPADKRALNVGQVYSTPNGNAQWDGSKFNLVAK